MTTDGYIHDALFYDSDDQLLTTALQADPRVRFASSAETYSRPPQAIWALRQLVEAEVAAGAGRVRVVGETEFGDSSAQWAQWMRYEAVINHALAPYPVWGVCLYDTRRLPRQVLASAELTHPNLRTSTSRAPNPRFVDPVEFVRRLPDVEPDPLEATRPTLEIEDVTDLRGLREQLHAALGRSSLASEAKSEFMFAVSEVATNAVRHGRPPTRVRTWATRNRVLCAVTDRGHGIQDPLAGYVPAPQRSIPGGLGLWLARRFCDRVDLRRTGEDFTVRLASGS